MTHPHLTVEVGELFPTLRKVLSQLPRRKALEAILAFDGEHFSIEFRGAQLGAKAAGEWKGSVRVSLAMIEGIAKTHVGPTIEMEYREGKVRIGSVSIAAKWQDITPALLDLAMDTPDAELLARCLEAPGPQVIATGLGPRLEKAKQALARKVAAAQKLLAAYGTSRDELEDFVIRCLKNHANIDATRIARAWIAERIDLKPVAWPLGTYGDFGPSEDYVVFCVPDREYVFGGSHYIAVHKSTGVVHDLGHVGD